MPEKTAGAKRDEDDGASSIAGQRRGGPWDTMLIRWLDKHADKIDKYWARFSPNFAGSAVATCAIFLLAACFRAEWLLLVVHFARRFGYNITSLSPASDASDSEPPASIDSPPTYWDQLLPENPSLRFFLIAWAVVITVSNVLYVGISTGLHWYFYVRRRDQAEEWKCQPYKWLSPALEKHEITLGMFSLAIVNTVTTAFVTYVFNGGPCMVYFNIDEYGWLYWFIQWPLVYIILDYETYWFHRMYHRPTLYKMFHKLHHTYKQPTAWSVTAIHPVEIVHMQLCYFVPLFIIPLHLIPYYTILMYNFYHGIIDHSGVNFKAQWWQPWQPDASFHDNHHQYTHVNFGFNMFFWDKLYGTYRQKDRIYNENTYYGRGKKISEATAEELAVDLKERELENVDNKIIYSLDKKSLLDHGKAD